MDEKDLVISPEGLNDPENIKKCENKNFTKSANKIKEQLEKLGNEYKRSIDSDDFSNEMNYKLGRLETAIATLNWVLRDDNTDL